MRREKPGWRKMIFEDKLEYRSLNAKDMKKVVILHAKAFGPEKIRHTIFYSPRAYRFLESLISYPTIQQLHHFLGVWAGRDLIAYAHYRLLQNSFHLNQIVVDPNYQSKGIGKYLVIEWAKRAKVIGLSHLTLDVDEENSRAFSWYCRMGLSPISKTYLYECEIEPKPYGFISSDFKLLDWENTIAWQKTYGFSTIRIEYQQKIWEVGWIWNSLHIENGFPKVLISGLFYLVPNTRWLFVRSSKPIVNINYSPGHWRLASIIVRMQASTEMINTLLTKNGLSL